MLWSGFGGETGDLPLHSRVVDRCFVFGDLERDKFRMFMRMQENFSGCRVLSYCVMSNHFHVLLEVPPMQEGGISDDELLKRLSAIQTEAAVAVVAKELAEARTAGHEQHVEEIHARYTYRMHGLSEFMKTLLQRFTRWFNRTHERSGTLWEERPGGGGERRGAAADEHGEGQRHGAAGHGDGGDVALPC